MTARGRNKVAEYVDAIREKDRLKFPASDDLQFTRYDAQGWRATFYPAGRGHFVTSAVGSAWESEPWMAVQRAAWESLRKAEAEAAPRTPHCGVTIRGWEGDGARIQAA